MTRWFASDASRWFSIGVIASSIFGNLVQRFDDPLTVTICLVLFVFLLFLLASALHGDRRPWLRTMDFTEKADGQIQLHDLAGDAHDRWAPAGR